MQAYVYRLHAMYICVYIPPVKLLRSSQQFGGIIRCAYMPRPGIGIFCRPLNWLIKKCCLTYMASKLKVQENLYEPRSVGTLIYFLLNRFSSSAEGRQGLHNLVFILSLTNFYLGLQVFIQRASRVSGNKCIIFKLLVFQPSRGDGHWGII